MHCHATPSLAPLVLELAEKFRIPAVRVPAEPLSYRGARERFSPGRFVEKTLLNLACRRQMKTWRGRLRVPSAFYGFMDGGDLSARSIETVARRVAPGTTELMTHPGLSDDDSPYRSPYLWRRDLEALLAHSREDFEARFGVRLVSYRDL